MPLRGMAHERRGDAVVGEVIWCLALSCDRTLGIQRQAKHHLGVDGIGALRSQPLAFSMGGEERVQMGVVYWREGGQDTDLQWVNIEFFPNRGLGL
jgi:hypothetical protein